MQDSELNLLSVNRKINKIARQQLDMKITCWQPEKKIACRQTNILKNSGKNWRFEPYFAGGRRKSNGQNPKKTSPTSLMRNAVWYPWRPYPRLLPKDELRTSNNQNDAQSSKGLISFNDFVIQEYLLILQVQYYLFANSPKSKRILLGENKRC